MLKKGKSFTKLGKNSIQIKMVSNIHKFNDTSFLHTIILGRKHDLSHSLKRSLRSLNLLQNSKNVCRTNYFNSFIVKVRDFYQCFNDEKFLNLQHESHFGC